MARPELLRLLSFFALVRGPALLQQTQDKTGQSKAEQKRNPVLYSRECVGVSQRKGTSPVRYHRSVRVLSTLHDRLPRRTVYCATELNLGARDGSRLTATVTQTRGYASCVAPPWRRVKMGLGCLASLAIDDRTMDFPSPPFHFGSSRRPKMELRCR